MLEKIINIFGLEKYQNIRKIPKNTFYKQDDFNKTNEKLFLKEIESINLISALNKTNINIKEYENEERIYLEIYFLIVELKSKDRVNEIANIIQTFIPNPSIIILKFTDEVKICSANKRKSKAEKDKQVIEDFFISNWIDLELLENSDENFLKDLDIHKNSFENFYRFYTGFSDKIFMHNIKNIIWEYKNPKWIDLEKLKKFNKEIKNFEKEKNILENQYKEEIEMWEKAKIFMKKSEIDKKINEIKNFINSI